MIEVQKYSSNCYLPYFSLFLWFLSFFYGVYYGFEDLYLTENVPSIIATPGVFVVILCLLGALVSVSGSRG